MAEHDHTPTSPNTTTVIKSRQRRRPNSPRCVVEIDQATIDNAIQRTTRHCMIAEAIKRALPEMTGVTVDLKTTRFTNSVKRLRYIYNTPDSVCQFLIDFDQGETLEPFSFKLQRAVQIVRAESANPIKTADEHREAVASNNRIATRVSTKNDEPFEPPIEERERIVRALDDPSQRLGPAMAIYAPGDPKGREPVIVGGKAPRSDNIIKRRLYGLRELRK